MDRNEKRFLKKLVMCAASIFTVLLILQMFVMNFTYAQRAALGYETKKISLVTSDGQNHFYQKDGTLIMDGSSSSAEMRSFKMPVKSIAIDLSVDCQDRIYYVLQYSDAATDNLRYLSSGYLSSDDEDLYFNTDFSGDMDRLKITLSGGSLNSFVKINSVTLNEPQSIGGTIGNTVTLFCLTFIAAFLTFVFYGMRKGYDKYCDRKSFCLNSAAGVTICACGFAVFLAFIYAYSTQSGSFMAQSGNQISQEIVDAFMNRQVSLLEEPSEALLSMANPYDVEERNALGVNYLWDHCFYNGKYYSYYGIGPVLALFLPYHIITGWYFPSVWAVLIFSVIGIIFLTKLYVAVIEKWFKTLPANIFLMGLVTIQAASGIFASAARPLFYEIAISSGFMCVAIGAYLLISSNIIGDGNINYKKLAFASFFLGYAVLCRPTLAIYCVAALFFFFFGFKKLLKNESGKKTKAVCKFLLCALLPLAVLAIIQMTYNYLRFSNPLDFGIQYSLTINDFTRSQFHFKYVLIAMWGYLFNMPHLSPTEMPLFSSSFEMFNLNGYMFVDDREMNLVSVGILFRALPIVSYLFAGKALKSIDKKKRPMAAVLVGVTCVLMPLIIIFSAWESGYAVRYNADFSFQMIIGALVIAFTIFKNIKSESTRKLVTLIFTVSTVYCVFINYAQSYTFIKGYF